MRRKKFLIYPTLRTRKGDTGKQWYVELSQRNPKTGEMVRKRVEMLDEVNINSLPTAEERYQFGAKIVELYTRKMKANWSIFSDTEQCVYEDQLQYSHAARVYKQQVESNNTYNYWIGKYMRATYEGKNLRPETRTTYTSRYRTFGLWLTSVGKDKLDITAIDNPVIIQFFNYLKGKRDSSTRTYRSYADLLGAFFRYLYNAGTITVNPIFNLPENRNVKDMGAERIQKAHMTRLIALMDKEDPQLALACRFEYYCGMRPGYEIRLLKVGDIDLRLGRGKVRVSMENAKTRQRREVAIPDTFLTYLLDIWELHKYNANDFVISKNGKPGRQNIGKNNLRYRFNAFRERLKLPIDYKFYSFKHTGAVALAEEGERIINIRDHLGHSSVHTTENYLKRHGFQDSEIIRKNFPAI